MNPGELTHHRHSARELAERWSHLLTPAQWRWALVCLTVFTLLFIDAMRHAYASFDVPLMQAIQRVDPPHLAQYTHRLDDLTGSEGATSSWAIVLVGLALRRWWAAAVATALMPLGGLINLIIGEMLVARTRPHLDELKRGSMTWEEPSFPSGHVMGAVLLFGFLYVVARRIDTRSIRLTVRGTSLLVIVTVGPARVWDGAHWPTDVISAYALGGLLLIPLLALEANLRPRLDGLAPVAAGREALRLVVPGHFAARG